MTILLYWRVNLRFFILCIFICNLVQADDWINFEWASETIDGESLHRAAILIPLQENQALQLDTGSPSSYLYAPHYKFDERKRFDFSTTTGGNISEDFHVHDTVTASDNIIGTLGAGYFSDAMLIIDFANQRFIKASTLPEEVSGSEVTYLPGNVTEAMHIVTSVTVGEETLAPIVFDTGSSIFKLVVTKDHWLNLVSEEAAENPNYTMKVPAWGRSVTLHGADAKAPICMGDICEEGAVFYTNDPQLDFSKAGLAGLVGNAILKDDYVLILDYLNKRVGTIKVKP